MSGIFMFMAAISLVFVATVIFFIVETIKSRRELAGERADAPRLKAKSQLYYGLSAAILILAVVPVFVLLTVRVVVVFALSEAEGIMLLVFMVLCLALSIALFTRGFRLSADAYSAQLYDESIHRTISEENEQD